MDIIKKDILTADHIDVSTILNKMYAFKDEIRRSIEKGETKFLTNASAKELAAYKDPQSNQAVKAVLAWNLIYPDNMIDLPSKVSLLKTNIFSLEDIEDLKDKDERVYNIIKEKIFNDTTGYFINIKKESMHKIKEKGNWWLEIPSKYRNKYKKLGVDAWNEFLETTDESAVVTTNVRGLQALAIPSTESIPEWVVPYIDYYSTVNAVLAPFYPVLKIFGVDPLQEGKMIKKINRKSKGLTNIIKL